MMKSFEYDLRYIQAGLDSIKEYLLSDEVFWPLGAHPPEGAPEYPRLTLDGVLLAAARLLAYLITPLQEVQRLQISSDLDLVRTKWRVAWEKKAGRCFSIRLRMWGDYLEEYRMNAQDNADRYFYEVRLRVMLQLLLQEVGEQPQTEMGLLAGLDGYLQRVLEKDGFIWEAEVQKGFPEYQYWYLYGNLSPQAVK